MKNFLPAKRGFEKSYHYLYEPHLTFVLPLSIGHKCPRYFDTTEGFHTVCMWYAAIHQINYMNWGFNL